MEGLEIRKRQRSERDAAESDQDGLFFWDKIQGRGQMVAVPRRPVLQSVRCVRRRRRRRCRETDSCEAHEWPADRHGEWS